MICQAPQTSNRIVYFKCFNSIACNLLQFYFPVLERSCFQVKAFTEQFHRGSSLAKGGLKGRKCRPGKNGKESRRAFHCAGPRMFV